MCGQEISDGVTASLTTEQTKSEKHIFYCLTEKCSIVPITPYAIFNTLWFKPNDLRCEQMSPYLNSSTQHKSLWYKALCYQLKDTTWRKWMWWWPNLYKNVCDIFKCFAISVVTLSPEDCTRGLSWIKNHSTAQLFTTYARRVIASLCKVVVSRKQCIHVSVYDNSL